MVNFAELRAKAEKAKDAGVAKVVNTKDRFSSIPASKTNWDPNWKRAPPSSASAPPPPLASRPTSPPSSARTSVHDLRSSIALTPEVTKSPPPIVPRASRPDYLSMSQSDVSTLPPPPKRFSSGYPATHKRTDSGSDPVADRIDWANLSAEDKEAFFSWLDEFFSRFLNVELGPRSLANKPLSASDHNPTLAQRTGPPTINTATRPHHF